MGRRTRVAALAAALCLPACGGTPDPDRSAEAGAACEAEVAKRLRVDGSGLRFSTTVQRFGSGGWDVEGTVASASGPPTPFVCGVYADGRRGEGRLRVDGVKVAHRGQ